MNTPLIQQDATKIHEMLQITLRHVERYLDEINTRPAANAFHKLDDMSLPVNGMGANATLEYFEQRFGKHMNANNGPRFWGLVTGGTTPAALIGDWLASAYDTNLSHVDFSIAPNIEFEAIDLLRALLNLPKEFFGVFVSGATMSNFCGLALAREWIAQQYGKSAAQNGLADLPRMRVLSSAPHSSAVKSLAMLGIGRDNLQIVGKIDDPTREAIDVVALERELQTHSASCIVVANAGSVNTVDFDDLRAIAVLKAKYNFWLHVDAAFGGFAACSPRYQHFVEGIELADSITVDLHKMLNVPYDSAVIFTRHRALQIEIFKNSASYLGDIGETPDFIHLTPENSRRLRALPAWFTLMAYGRDGYTQLIEHLCKLTHDLATRIQHSAQFRLLAPPRFNVACFTLTRDASQVRVRDFLNRLRDDGRVMLTPTTFAGMPAIRAALSNWRTTPQDVDIAWQAMQDCARD